MLLDIVSITKFSIEAAKAMVQVAAKKDIVYCYNHKNIIFITRTRDGKWRYNYKIGDIFDVVNRNLPKKEHYNPSNPDHLWQVGQRMGVEVVKATDKCKKSYGDDNL